VKIKAANYRAVRALQDSCWHERVAILWEEDDALTPDREGAGAAFERIVGQSDRVLSVARHVDLGDCSMTLFTNGWVLGLDCSGGFVGRLCEVFE
jgi:hypothetical protein